VRGKVAVLDELRQAIEQAEKAEPVGTVVEDDNDFGRVKALLDQDARVQLAVGADLYTHPPTAPAQPDTKEAMELLSAVFDAWENGTPCYEGPENYDGFVGTAFSLDDDIFKRCCDLLNRVNPPRNAPTAPAQPAKYPCKLTDAELADPEYMRSYIEAMNQDYADLLYAAPAQPSPLQDPKDKPWQRDHYPQCKTCNKSFYVGETCGWVCDGVNMYSPLEAHIKGETK
jgi:hypothetical protein